MQPVIHYLHDEDEEGDHSPRRVYVFDTKLANDAAQAVAGGRMSSIIEYHEMLYNRNHREEVSQVIATSGMSTSISSESLHEQGLE